jgi:hypothetical protein
MGFDFSLFTGFAATAREGINSPCQSRKPSLGDKFGNWFLPTHKPSVARSQALTKIPLSPDAKRADTIQVPSPSRIFRAAHVTDPNLR